MSDTSPSLPSGVEVASPGIRFGGFLLEGVLMTVTLFIGWLIWASMTAKTGQTPAKKILKLRVFDPETSQPATLGKMLLMRGIVGGIVMNIAGTFTLGIIYLMPLWDKKKQNLWDKISGTYVVSDPADAWNTAAA